MHVQLFLCFLILLLFIWVRKRTRKMRVFLEMGIPGPEPNVLFGNFLEIFMKGSIVCHSEWIRKYGRVLGYYHGTKPVLLVTDTELLRQIQIKDFQKFSNRAVLFEEDLDSDNIRMRNLLTLKGVKWKMVRSLITPSFTSNKMKQMSPIMKGATDILVEKIESKCQSGEIFDIHEFYKGLTMDVIGRTAFGIDTNTQRNPKDPMIRLLNIFLQEPFAYFFILMMSSFPFLSPLFRILRVIIGAIENQFTNPLEEIESRVYDIVRARMKDPSLRRVDLLQLMIDAKIKGETRVDDSELIAGSDVETSQDSKASEKDSPDDKNTKQLTIDEVVGNVLLFFAAGYETTSTALAFATIVLANFPEVQEKIRKEVDEITETEGKLDYSSVQKMQYLDSVFMEIVRLYPPVHLFVNREAAEDVQYGKIRILKGMGIQVPVYLLHRDPEYWPEPEKFIPERFAPENRSKNNPLAWQPFGAGPRNCVGMRFAQMEAKMALAPILQKYNFVRCHRTDTLPLDLAIRPVFLSPKYGVPIRVTRREA